MRTSRGTRPVERPKFNILTAALCCAALIAVVIAMISMRAEKKDGMDISTDAVGEGRMIHVLTDGGITDMELEEYIVGVVAAEMPAYYESEALKAQAVAARTYTVRKAEHGGCSEAEGADICTRSGHCQAYADEKRLMERWGEDYDKNIAKMRDAVEGTDGQIIVYGGEAIEALFHASAGGMTEASENVYKNAQPYLKSVENGRGGLCI